MSSRVIPAFVERVRGRRDRRGQHVDGVGAPARRCGGCGRAACTPWSLDRPLRHDQHRAGGVGDLARRPRPSAGPPRRAAAASGHLRQVVSRRGPSSAVTPASGTISRSKRPSAGPGGPGGGSRRANSSIVLPGDPPLLGDHLGAAELRHLLVPVAGHPALGPGERIGEAELARPPSSTTRSGSAHVLHAAGDDDVVGARS